MHYVINNVTMINVINVSKAASAKIFDCRTRKLDYPQSESLHTYELLLLRAATDSVTVHTT